MTVLITQDGQVVAVRLVGSKEALVATISQYFLAPVTAPQLKVSVVDTAVAPFVGAEREGAESTVESPTENARQPELVPSEFATLTFQLPTCEAKFLLILICEAEIDEGISGPCVTLPGVSQNSSAPALKPLPEIVTGRLPSAFVPSSETARIAGLVG